MDKVTVRGIIPEIIWNYAGLYEGNLVKYFQAVCKASNVHNPYHNVRHTGHVLWLCYQACFYYAERRTERLTKRRVRNLLIAVLFHDFGHTGKSGPDSVNIKRAIAGLKRHINKFDRPYLGTIVSLMKATEYPHTVSSDQLSLEDRILRDVDQGQALDVSWIQQVILGLAAEWGKTPLEIFRLQRPFLENIEFSTDWAKERFPRSFIDAKIAEAEEFIDILTA